MRRVRVFVFFFCFVFFICFVCLRAYEAQGSEENVKVEGEGKVVSVCCVFYLFIYITIGTGIKKKKLKTE